MKLALIIDDYLPDSTRVGAKMFHELAVELLRHGHQVTVITPEINGCQRLSYDNIDGVNIWRFKSGPIKDVPKVQRAINETLLSFRAWLAVRSNIKRDTFDGVIYYSPSIFWGRLVHNIKKRCHCPAYLVLRDMFPQWVIDAGMLRSGSLFEKYFRFFEKYSYEQANGIGLMSDRNLDIFRVHNRHLPCEVLRNWANVNAYVTRENENRSFRDKLGLHKKTIFFYGGNIGHAQDMANLMRLAKNMQKYQDAHFLFVGQGDEVELIKQLACEWNLSNFSYLPSISQVEFKCLLSEVDIGLFSLAANHTSHNFPGKLLGYMVQSLPILGSVNAGNDLMDIVNKSSAGFIHENGQDEQLFTSAERLLLDENLRLAIGKSAHKLLIDQFSVYSAAQTIENRLEASGAFN